MQIRSIHHNRFNNRIHHHRQQFETDPRKISRIGTDATVSWRPSSLHTPKHRDRQWQPRSRASEECCRGSWACTTTASRCRQRCVRVVPKRAADLLPHTNVIIFSWDVGRVWAAWMRFFGHCVDFELMVVCWLNDNWGVMIGFRDDVSFWTFFWEILYFFGYFSLLENISLYRYLNKRKIQIYDLYLVTEFIWWFQLNIMWSKSKYF